MAYIKCIIICLLFYLLNGVDCGILCENGFCRSHLLETDCLTTSQYCRINNATHSGMFMLSPTICNCCEFCLPFYGEDQHCSVGGPGLGTTVGRCGAGLTCVPDPSDGYNYCERMTSVCHTAQDKYDENHKAGKTGALEQRPLCNEKGKFAAFDCVPTQTCFCQSEDGERLFGEVYYQGQFTLQNMHCGCSTLHHKIKQTISEGVRYPIIGPRCTSDGNFNPVQCTDRICYCVDRITGEYKSGRIDLDEQPLSALSCYDETLDLWPELSNNYTTPCFEEMKERIELIEESEEDGYIVDFFSEVPECLPDGTYGRIRKTLNNTKICVDERRNRIGDYEAEEHTPEYDNMDCKCALTSLLMVLSNEKPVCCKNGNFRRIQCRRGLCRCVDSDGRQTEQESSDVTTLSCYTENWRTC